MLRHLAKATFSNTVSFGHNELWQPMAGKVNINLDDLQCITLDIGCTIVTFFIGSSHFFSSFSSWEGGGGTGIRAHYIYE